MAERREPADGELGRFCADLRELLVVAGLTQAETQRQIREIDESAQLSTSQLSAILTGRIATPPDWTHVRAIVEVCRQTGRLSVAQGSEGDWKTRHENLNVAHEVLRRQRSFQRRPRLPRVLDRDRASLQPQNFPPVARPHLLRAALSARDRQAEGIGRRVALVVTGDGGVGKSILLGQLLERLDAAGEAVVLVSAAQVSLETLRAGVVDADRALGEAVHPLGGMGMIEILEHLARRHGRVSLLLDTLDLILDRHSLPGLSAVLAEALEIGAVVLTCRDHEYQTHLGISAKSTPSLAGRLTRFQMRPLDAGDIVRWAENYVSVKNPEPTASDAAFLRVLTERVNFSRSLREVCALPVRLAMACDVYAAAGHIPPDLTTTRLFGAYWDARVRRTVDGVVEPAKEQAALVLAEALVKPEGSLGLRIPRGTLSDELTDGLNLLASEGAVRALENEWEFFHQSFAEYAHGRWLLSQGLDSEPIAYLAQNLRIDDTNLWPLAKFLLSQVDDFEDYRLLTARFPTGTPEAAQSHVVAALGRSEPGSVPDVLARIEPSPARLEAILPVLAEAPDRHLEIAFDAVIGAFTDHPGELSLPAVAALEALLPRIPPDDLPGRLTAGLTAAAKARRHMDHREWENLSARLLATLGDTLLTEGVLTAMREFYPRLSPLARREAITAHLQHPVTPIETADLARRVLSVRCPPLTDTTAVDLMGMLWECKQVRTERGWSSWRDLLVQSLPHGWDNAQVKFVTALGAKDVTVCTGLLDEILGNEKLELTRHVNVLSQLTRHHPDWIAEQVLKRPLPRRAGVGSVAHTMKEIRTSAEIRLRLLKWLVPGRELAPKNVWPAQIALAGDSVAAHLRILDDLAGAKVPPEVVAAMLRSWMHNVPLAVLAVLAERLRPMLNGKDGQLTQTWARLEGKLALDDPQARAWLANVLLRGPSPAVAKTVMKTLQVDVDADAGDLTPWLVTLVESPHTDAVMRLVQILLDPERVDDHALAGVTSTLPDMAIRRMRLAVHRDENPDLIRNLLKLIIRLDRLTPLDRGTVQEVYLVTRSRLPDEPQSSESGRYSAAIRDVSTLCGSLLPGTLTRSEIRDLLSELLMVIDPATLGRKITKTLTTLLIGIGRHDPGALDWLEDLFAHPDPAPKTKYAIARAVVRLDGAERGGRAWRLLTVAGCPEEVKVLILEQGREFS